MKSHQIPTPRPQHKLTLHIQSHQIHTIQPQPGYHVIKDSIILTDDTVVTLESNTQGKQSIFIHKRNQEHPAIIEDQPELYNLMTLQDYRYFMGKGSYQGKPIFRVYDCEMHVKTPFTPVEIDTEFHIDYMAFSSDKKFLLATTSEISDYRYGASHKLNLYSFPDLKLCHSIDTSGYGSLVPVPMNNEFILVGSAFSNSLRRIKILNNKISFLSTKDLGEEKLTGNYGSFWCETTNCLVTLTQNQHLQFWKTSGKSLTLHLQLELSFPTSLETIQGWKMIPNTPYFITYEYNDYYKNYLNVHCWMFNEKNQLELVGLFVTGKSDLSISNSGVIMTPEGQCIEFDAISNYYPSKLLPLFKETPGIQNLSRPLQNIIVDYYCSLRLFATAPKDSEDSKTEINISQLKRISYG